LVSVKNNLAIAQTLRYRTVQTDGGVAVEFLGPTSHTAADLAEAGGEPSRSLKEAMWFLFVTLHDGPLPAKEVVSAANNAGISKRTLERAKLGLQVESFRRVTAVGATWLWRLPDNPELLKPFEERLRDTAIDEMMHDGDTPDD
jgi:hypothetical protein